MARAAGLYKFEAAFCSRSLLSTRPHSTLSPDIAALGKNDSLGICNRKSFRKQLKSRHRYLLSEAIGQLSVELQNSLHIYVLHVACLKHQWPIIDESSLIPTSKYISSLTSNDYSAMLVAQPQNTPLGRAARL